MIQYQFAEHAKKVLANEKNIIGLAVAGSSLTNEIDEFSDLDLILVIKEKISIDKDKMFDYAKRLGNLISGFTGEHVGEPEMLICLYDNPLLHVDIKFVTLEEFHRRTDTPKILMDTETQLQQALDKSLPQFPYPDYQWIEDRFWIWVHYALLKIGRGEYMEAYDFFSYLRTVVFGPLLHMKNGNKRYGVRKVETELPKDDFQKLLTTIPSYHRNALLDSLKNAVELYRHLRLVLYNSNILLHHNTEKKVMEYFDQIILRHGRM